MLTHKGHHTPSPPRQYCATLRQGSLAKRRNQESGRNELKNFNFPARISCRHAMPETKKHVPIVLRYLISKPLPTSLPPSLTLSLYPLAII